MATTNVPPVTFGPRGFIAPAESDVLAGVQQDIDSAFGGGLNPALETPQGQLASSETAIIGQANDTFVKFTNQVDPAYSEGRMQDAIARIYFLERNPALPTIVSALCTGLAGTVIPAGAIAKASDGNLYSCTDGGTIPISGSITLTFACNTVGPIVCPADTLTTIYQAIPGWDSINNVAEGVIGNDAESRAAFEERRAATTAGNSFGSIGAIIGAVAKVPGVLDYYGYDNGTNAPVTITGVTIDANSIFICVAGGAQADVAQAILSKKAPGCAYTGNTSVTAYDTNPLYAAPVAYTVKFQISADLPILFSVSLANNAQVPANALALIQGVIVNAFSGADGGPRARIGSKLFASRFYSGVAALGPWVQIVAITVGSENNPDASFTASIAAANMTVSAVASGTIVVGGTVVGSGVADGTTIVSQTSGPAGGAGVYVVSMAQTVASESMKSATPSLNDIQVNIGQEPTIAAANIALVLV